MRRSLRARPKTSSPTAASQPLLRRHRRHRGGAALSRPRFGWPSRRGAPLQLLLRLGREGLRATSSCLSVGHTMRPSPPSSTRRGGEGEDRCIAERVAARAQSRSSEGRSAPTTRRRRRRPNDSPRGKLAQRGHAARLQRRGERDAARVGQPVRREVEVLLRQRPLRGGAYEQRSAPRLLKASPGAHRRAAEQRRAARTKSAAAASRLPPPPCRHRRRRELGRGDDAHAPTRRSA